MQISMLLFSVYGSNLKPLQCVNVQKHTDAPLCIHVHHRSSTCISDKSVIPD